MKRNNKLWLALVLACVVALAAGLTAGFATHENVQSDTQVLEAAVNAEVAIPKMTVIPLDVLAQQPEETRYSEASIAQAKQKAVLDFHQYYVGARADRYQQKYQDYQKKLDLSALDVDAGATDIQLIQMENISNTERRIQFSFVGYLTTIYRQGDQYQVWVIYSKQTLTKLMQLEDDSWKTIKVEDHLQEFAPDGYEYDKGLFDTMEEAVAFVQSMDMEAENPF